MDSYGRDEAGRPAIDVYRRRSPGSFDRRQGRRNRSRSPPQIDRYQPDPYRAREDVPRRRNSPPPVQAGIDRYVPGHDPPTPAITHNPLPNPMSLDYQVGFTWFAEWWRVEQAIKEEKERAKNGGRRPERLKGEKESREERGKEREQIQAAYDAYKEKLQVQMAKNFVELHKDEEWFKERYNPDVRIAFRQRLAEFRRGAYSKWEQDLDAGVFDEFTLEGIYKSESNGAGGVIEKEEGETTAANEVLGVGDLLPSRGGDLRDDLALQPTLLIKTIAPTVTRDNMEAFCKEHLGEDDGGFKWLSLSDPNPAKKCHRIGWVILNPSLDREMTDDRGDGRDEDGEEVDEIKLEFKLETPNTAQKALAEINGKTIHDEKRGDFTCHVGIHEPPAAPRKKALWDLFSAPERIDRDLQLAMRIVHKLDSDLSESHDYDGITRVETRVEELRSKGWLQPPVNAPSSSKKMQDPDDMEEGEEGMIDEEEEGLYDEEVDDEELLSKKKRLDLLVEYLRRVHNFCFFCVFESDSVHELTRKCPGGHLRRPRSSLTTAAKAAAKASAAGQPFPLKRQESTVENDQAGSPVEEKKFSKIASKTQQQLSRAFNWVKTYEEKLLQILEPESVDIKKLGGKPYDEALEEALSKYVKQEDENKWRCKVPECTKLFKGQNFWKKHVEKRHEEFLDKIQKDVTLLNAYVLDPAHIAPSRSDANSNGHFANNSNAPTGTPRGFNLANIPFGFPPAMAAGLPNPAVFGAFLSQQGMPPGWPSSNPLDVNDERAGPRRTGNRYNNNRMGGPYDRQGKDARNARWTNPAGRLTPPRTMNVRGGGPRFADAAAAVGPKEAVAGRSLKSYEDLDAAGGGGTGELDY